MAASQHCSPTVKPSTQPTTHVLSLRDIAAWQLPQLAAGQPSIIAAIPSLQRNAVWKPQQVELLWDSILRGFPVGALTVSEVLQGQQSRAGKHGSGWDAPAITHHLLDGQQRCNAIALGWVDPLDANADTTLWLDIQPATYFSASSSRAFLLRLCTRAHPWGYDTPDELSKLSASQIRSALAQDYAWPTQPHEDRYQRPHPSDTWPHKAGVPLPLAWLLEAAAAATPQQPLWQRVRTRLQAQFAQQDLHANHWARKAERFLVEAAQPHNDASLHGSLHDISQALQRALGFAVVALTVPQEALSRPTRQEGASTADNATDDTSELRIANVEHLFQRLNAGGTELRGDELLYSMVKAYWPGIEATIDSLPRRPPATQVALLGTRVALTDAAITKPRGALSVSQLRAIAHPPESDKKELHLQEQQQIEQMFGLHAPAQSQGSGDAEIARILQRVDEWLLYDAQKNPWGLPPVLRSQLAQQCPEMFFFLMLLARTSLHQPIAARHDKAVRRRLLGLATAVHWFGTDAQAAVRQLWSAKSPTQWLTPRAFEGVLEPLKHLGEGKTGVVDLRSPRGLAKIIQVPTHDTLEDWSWWHTLIATPAAGDDDAQNARHDKYWPLLEKLPYCQPLLMYCQRAWMAQRFGQFDRYLGDYWDEHNRPWDFDHILPQAYFTQKRNAQYMKVCQEWGYTIGNLHILRFEENRSRQDQRATDSIANTHIDMAWLRDGNRDLRPAFSLRHDDVRGGSKERSDAVLGFVCAARTRLLRLYQEWYEQLDIAALLGKSNG